MRDEIALLPGLLTAHLQLTLLALLVGTIVSVPAGIIVSRARRLERPVLAIASVIQTIPALALLALMVPVLAALGLRSIGFVPAFIGLVLYSVLPILRNTVTAIANIDPDLREAARGVGMTSAQSLLRVELPLALPVIVAGIRTATVWTVGMATLSTPIGAPSLGNYIFSGLQTRNLTAILVGCVAAAILALVLDALVHATGKAVVSRRRGRLVAPVGAALVLYAYVGASLVAGFSGGRPEIVIGAKTFTEQYILSRILARHLEATTGAPVRVVASLGSTVAFDALRTGDIDAYVDYSGTLWATILGRTGLPPRREAVLEEVRRFLAARDGIEVAAALGFENAYALAMRRDRAGQLAIRTISDLTPHASRMTIGGDYEFFSRPEWAALQRTYGLSFAAQRSMDPSLMYQAAAAGNVDVITAFSTDGRIEALDLRIIEDDRGAIPPYDAIVLVGPRLVRERPDAVTALRELDGTIDDERMRRMNLAVDGRGESPDAVAARFLREIGRQQAKRF